MVTMVTMITMVSIVTMVTMVTIVTMITGKFRHYVQYLNDQDKVRPQYHVKSPGGALLGGSSLYSCYPPPPSTLITL